MCQQNWEGRRNVNKYEQPQRKWSIVWYFHVKLYFTIVLCLNILWLKAVNEMTARQASTSLGKFNKKPTWKDVCGIEYLTTEIELVLPNFKSWTVYNIIGYLTLGLLSSLWNIYHSTTANFFDAPVCVHKMDWRFSVSVCVKFAVLVHILVRLTMFWNILSAETRQCRYAQCLHVSEEFFFHLFWPWYVSLKAILELFSLLPSHYRVGQKTILFLKVCNSCICWHRKSFHVSNYSVLNLE